MTFGDYAFSTQFRDVIKQMVDAEIERLRPAYRYGRVQSFNTTTHKCVVILNGDTNGVIVNYGSAVPAVNYIVRVAGIGTDRYVDDVVGPG